ncbi:DDE Tnp 1 7 and/or HTH Tnp Tc3 2 domain containing protein [Asbolus verrucosus]|uniref:DDE Tnp 1 7 and/or HTH Tnp Tc3 2 domain containing protein n=1 Tax=Asbolus verrucosus TaxID=1661398 RepID=A0A482VDE3_ASBVE|nr:DDE Tnp 1 7 and/or HTH Tnp Tc3 2 domain containing protein [Asbolus verrucosus]
MPRIRQLQQYSHITDFQKSQVVALKNQGVSYRIIGRQIGCNVMTVMRWWTRWTEEANVRRRNESGVALECHLHVKINVFYNKSNWKPLDCGYRASKIRSFGLRSYRPLLTLPLTPEHRARRLEWCRERSHWVQEWDHVVFSNESRFCLWTHDGRKRVRRFREKRQNPNFFAKRQTTRTPEVMMWGAICRGSRSPLVFTETNLTAASYIANVLEPICMFFDNFFTSIKLLADLRNKGYRATGTIRNNRILKTPLVSEKEVSKRNRGDHDFVFDEENKIFLVR